MNDSGEIVEGAIASMLYDLYDDLINPQSQAQDDDDVSSTSYMMPKILSCLTASDYSSPTWSFRLFAERLVRDGGAPWAGETQFQSLRSPICQIFNEHHFTVAASTAHWCSGSSADDDSIDYSLVDLPLTFHVSQSYPNPFNGTATIQFCAPSEGSYRLDVYNITGQRLYRVLEEIGSPGLYRFQLSETITKDWASGVYFYIVSGAGQSKTKKMVYLK